MTITPKLIANLCAQLIKNTFEPQQWWARNLTANRQVNFVTEEKNPSESVLLSKYLQPACLALMQQSQPVTFPEPLDAQDISAEKFPDISAALGPLKVTAVRHVSSSRLIITLELCG